MGGGQIICHLGIKQAVNPCVRLSERVQKQHRITNTQQQQGQQQHSSCIHMKTCQRGGAV